MLESDYEIEQVLIELLYTIDNETITKLVIELLTLLNNFGYNDIDTQIMTVLDGKELANDEVCPCVAEVMKTISSSILGLLGIQLTADAKLGMYRDVFMTLYTVNTMDDTLKGPILTILRDESKDSVEKMAAIITLHSTTGYVSAFEQIEYVTDDFISKYSMSIADAYDLSMDSDVDVFEEAFGQLTGILSIDSIMTKTYVARTMMCGVEVNTSFKDNLHKLAASVELLPEEYELFAADTATLLYVSDDTKEDMLNNYIMYVEDNLLSDLPVSVVAKITSLVTEHIYKLEKLNKG